MQTHLSSTELSIIVPAYNEEKRLPETLTHLIDFVQNQPHSIEVVIVDDGSTDDTAEIVQRAMQKHKWIRLIENPHAGKSYTVRTGIKEAKGLYCLHADADLSTPPEDFLRLIDALGAGYDIAIGSRAGRPGAPWYRKVMSRAWRWLVSLLVIRGFRDTQCGFKAYRTTVAQEVLNHTRLYNSLDESLSIARVTAASDVEILFLARKLGYTITEVNVSWNYAGDTKINPVMDSTQAFIDLFKIRWYYIVGLYAL